jgi:SAM-dependent methyltransferase
MPARSRFDAEYFQRFYHGADRTHAPREVARLASGVSGLAEWLGVRIESILDVGAGTGIWRGWFRRHRPEALYRSVDVSTYACERYGHEQRDISRWRGRDRFDLVICQSVLQYLDDDAAARAIRNLGAMTRGLLYLEAITARARGTASGSTLTSSRSARASGRRAGAGCGCTSSRDHPREPLVAEVRRTTATPFGASHAGAGRGPTAAWDPHRA